MLKCGKNQPSVRLISIYRGENTWVFTAILSSIGDIVVLERPATLGSLEGGTRHKVVGGMKYERSSYGTSPNPLYLRLCKNQKQ